jgi:hypothetical protein
MTNEDARWALDEVANAMQVVAGVSTQLRRELGTASRLAVDLEAAVDKVIRALKRVQPRRDQHR